MGKINLGRRLSDRHKKTILIVEDDEAVSNMMKTLLSDNGYAVIQCMSSHHIWKILHSVMPDLITMDYWISSANGVRLCKELREDEDFACIPVLFLSGADFDKKELEGMGEVSFLPKPFRVDSLISEVVRIIGR